MSSNPYIPSPDKTRDTTHPAFWLVCGGCLLVVSGIVHSGIWLVDGSSLDGDVSWRKPILFGFSAGATLLSLAWVATRQRARSLDRWLLPTLSLAMVLEVSLITLQSWRGVPSHFNSQTPLDAAILFGIESLATLITVCIAEMTRRCWTGLNAEPEMRLAIRGGMFLLLFSCLLGFILVIHGNQQLATNQSPGAYGKSGVMKFPHGIPMHAIQYLPFLVWTLRKLRVNSRQRIDAVRNALVFLVGCCGYSLLQTFTGRSRFEWWWPSALVLFISIAFLIPILSLLIGQSRFLLVRSFSASTA